MNPNFWLLSVYLQRMNRVNKLPPQFFEFFDEWLKKNEFYRTTQINLDDCKKIERGLIGAFYTTMHKVYKSRQQKRYNNWHTRYFEILEDTKDYREQLIKNQKILDK